MTQSKFYIVTDDLVIYAPDSMDEMDQIRRSFQADRPEKINVRFIVLIPGTEVVDLRGNRAA